MIRNLLLLVCLCAWLPAAAHPYAVEQIENVQSADRTRFTSNPDGILSQAAVARIDSICYGLRQRGAAQVAVVAVDAIAGGDPFTFAYELFSKWGVGRREDSNGVGILLVREQREIRFVTGRGVEGVLPDALCKRIQTNYMLPAFREGDYDRGMVRGVEAVAAVLAGSELETGVPDAVPQEDDTPWWVIALIVGGCVAVPLVAVVRMLRCPRCKRWFALRSQGERIVLRAEGWRMVEQTLVCRRCGETIRRRRREADGSDIGGPYRACAKKEAVHLDSLQILALSLQNLPRQPRESLLPPQGLRGRQLRRRRCRFEMVKSKKAAGRLVTLSVRPY